MARTRPAQEQRPAGLTPYRGRHLADRGWRVFLAAFIELFRIKRRRRPDSLALNRFFQARDALLPDQSGAQAEDVLAGPGRTRVQAVLTRLSADNPLIPSPLEPMLPTLAETVLSWSGGGRRQVLVTHDERSALTAGRLRRLQQVLAGGAGFSPSARLAGSDRRFRRRRDIPGDSAAIRVPVRWCSRRRAWAGAGMVRCACPGWLDHVPAARSGR